MATAKKTAASAPARARRRVDVNDDADDTTPVASSSYFATVGDKGDLKFFSSGCAGMNAALAGGWPCGRVSNIVGDKSSGKTLLAIEASANFAVTFPTQNIYYREAEAAFDKSYAGALGLPLDRVDFGERKLETIEDFYKDCLACLDTSKGEPALYVVDSLDALSDEAEQKRDFTDASYGGTKPKKLGELFRRLVKRIEAEQMHLMVISQLRDRLNVTFGEKQTRSGGRALDYYASHIVWLAEIGKIKRTIDKVERVVGVDVRSRVKKNKVGLAHREFSYPILFGYGIDDLTANAEWLIKVGALERLARCGLSKAGYKVRIGNVRNKGGADARELRELLQRELLAEWQEIEMKFLPQSSKY